MSLLASIMRRDGDHIPFVESGCSYPIRAGNAVRPLVDGEPAFRRICEAVEAAEHSVWVTVAFVQRDFAMPDGRGSLFDVLDRAAARGLDVRALFWRHEEFERISPGQHFSGTAAEREMLRQRGSRFLARWDRAHGPYCQHQKSWLIDAGRPNEVAFVGGINLENSSVVSPGHAPTDGDTIHDVYVELRGPSASDVHHNFAQRWNGASDRDHEDGRWPTRAGNGALPFPERASRPAGDAVVQIQRTVRRERYSDGRAAPDAEPFPIAGGEHSILAQYLQAIDAARSSIYIEDQAIAAPQIIDALARALHRGVHVGFVVPVEANPEVAKSRDDPRNAPFYESLAALGRFQRLTLAGLSSQRPDGSYQNVYVHAKIALFDDAFCTIGSTNIANRSFYGDTELNASIWHATTVRALRCELLREHLELDTQELDDAAALKLFARAARDNATRRATGQAQQGLLHALDPARYP